ncbi:ComEA family DNA-binding protein [Kaarinaea lacus]
MKYLRNILFAVVFAMVSFSVWASPVDINRADADTLATELTGVGESKAAAIVAYREANGPFQRIDDLVNVKGIGDKTLEKNRENLVIESDKENGSL